MTKGSAPVSTRGEAALFVVISLLAVTLFVQASWAGERHTGLKRRSSSSASEGVPDSARRATESPQPPRALASSTGQFNKDPRERERVRKDPYITRQKGFTSVKEILH